MVRRVRVETTNATFAADGTWQSAVAPSGKLRFYRPLLEDR